MKNQQEILSKLNIDALNPMQESALDAISSSNNTILLSPTGTGKTLAFLLPVLDLLDHNNPEVQVLILVPSRELAIQIEQVIRNMGTGFKVNAIYGGRAMSKDKIELKHTPAILVGTPGRILDHFMADRFTKEHINTLILDEFDKSLEVGFEEEMTEILAELPNLKKRILTSATEAVKIPKFVGMENPRRINYLKKNTPSKLTISTVISEEEDKLKTLVQLLKYIGEEPGIIFCNLKDSIDTVSSFLSQKHILHECFSGGMEQKDRERALIKFRNGSSRILVATDLAGRGIDIPELKYIIHYELPQRVEEFTHRNGRTARVNEAGTAYVVKWDKEKLPGFASNSKPINIGKTNRLGDPFWETLFISGGRKDKISKGDIAGLFFKQGGLKREQLGDIELKQDCAFVAVPKNKSKELVDSLNNSRLKKKKVRITVL